MTSVSSTPRNDELFQEIILDHYRHPRHKGLVNPANVTSRGYNPLCGDVIELSLTIQGDQIESVGFEGQGCSIAMASASMMSEAIWDQTLTSVRDLNRRLRSLVVEGKAPDQLGELGDLEALAGVHLYAARIKCALLPWSALELGFATLGNEPQ